MAPAASHPEVKGVTALTPGGYTRATAAAIFAEGGASPFPCPGRELLGRAAAIFTVGSLAGPAAGGSRDSAAGEGGGDSLLPGSAGNPAGFTFPPAEV